MTMTAALVKQTSNWLRYLIQHDGEAGDSVTITTTGAASPDLLTDSVGAGPIKALAKVITDGFAQFPAGAQTLARARALWLSDWTTSPGNANTTTARCRISPRVGVGGNWTVEANLDGENFPIIQVTEAQLGGVRSAYLDVEVPQAIGQGGINNSEEESPA